MRKRLEDVEAAAQRRSRAIESPLDVRWRGDARFVHLVVRNPAHQSHYDVVFPAHPTREHAFCTCADFARRGLGTCKHVEAAWLWLEDRAGDRSERPEPPSQRAVWDEVDRRQRALPRLRLPAPLALRYPGEALLTRRPSPARL